MENKHTGIYFDNGSTSYPKAPKVADAVAHLLSSGAFNINRGSYEGAYEVAGMVLDTREKLAELFMQRRPSRWCSRPVLPIR